VTINFSDMILPTCLSDQRNATGGSANYLIRDRPTPHRGQAGPPARAGWLLAVCATGQASAATVKLLNFFNHKQVFITFEGDIAVGDNERLNQVAEQGLALGKPMGGIFLNSGDGNLGEAAKIADGLFRHCIADGYSS
jgi:hypothetical protein